MGASFAARMIVKYSEQLVFQPLDEIRYWFTADVSFSAA
jgi:hypothetical protein